MDLFILLELKINIFINFLLDLFNYLFLISTLLNNENNYIITLFNKETIIYWFNVLNFIKYAFYKKLKYIMINIYFYFFRFFLVFLYSNMPNIIKLNFIYYYYTIKNYLRYYYKYVYLGYIKPSRFWRLYYRFYHIGYLKILIFFFSFIIILLMWKRRNTYLKRFFIWNIILFYIISISLSFLLWPLFLNKFLALFLSILISFFIIYLKLN